MVFRTAQVFLFGLLSTALVQGLCTYGGKNFWTHDSSVHTIEIIQTFLPDNIGGLTLANKIHARAIYLSTYISLLRAL